MANLIPAQTRHEIARSIYRDIITGHDFFYVFAGKSFEEADTPVDTRHYISDVHRNMLLAKRVVPGPYDVVYMIRRKDWESGTIYVEYSDYEELAYDDDGVFVVEDFYVMTDEYNIYKCIRVGRNSQGVAIASTIKPTSTTPEPVVLSDGYCWKFMYEVPVIDRIKFLTTDYIPVRNVSDGVNFNVNGVIEEVRIESPGEGYNTPYLVIKGDGLVPTTITFNGGTAVDSANDTIEYPGHNFATGDAVTYNTGGGTSITNLTNNTVYYTIFYTNKEIRLAASLVDAENGAYINIASGVGLSHSLTPVGTTSNVTIDGAGSITSVTVTNSMRGYTHARAIMYDAKTTPADYSPSISGSENYSGTISTDSTTRLVLGTDTDFTNELEDGWTIVDSANNVIGVVSNIISSTELELVTFPEVELANSTYSAFSGNGFQGIVVLGAETASGINQDVVLETIHGAIYKVDILDGGAGYDTATVEVIGDGTGAELYIDPDDDIVNGVIKNVQILDYGQNYNYARIVINGLPTEVASVRANVGPQRGHGFNIAQELFAHTLCISTTITTENADLFQGNDYRQLGIVKNLKLYNATQDVDIGYFQKDTGTSSFIVTVPEDEYNEYSIDDEIESSTGGIYKVLTKLFDASTETYKVYLAYVEGTEGLTTENTFTNNTTEFENLTCTNVEDPEFDKNTGTIIYVNDFSPITRTAEQIETIKLFLHF
jgi:hypothetical protein